MDTLENCIITPVGLIFAQIAVAINDRPTHFLDGVYHYLFHSKQLLRDNGRGAFVSATEYEARYLLYLNEWADKLLSPNKPYGDPANKTYLEINVQTSRGLSSSPPHRFSVTIDVK